MPWEEELARLDAAFAEGHVTRKEYRRLRDDLLATASAPASASNTPEPAKPATQAPVRWRADNPGEEQANTVTPVSSGTGGDKKPGAALAVPAQTVANPAVPSQPNGALGGPRTSAPLGPAAPVVRPFAARGDARLDGQEVFRSARPHSRFRLLPIVVIVALLAVGAGVVSLIGERHGGNRGFGGRALTAPAGRAAVASLTALADQLPALPGVQKPGTGIVDPVAGVQLGLYSAALSDGLHANGAHRVLLRLSQNGGFNYALLVVPSRDSADAAGVTTEMGDYERSVGMVTTSIAGLPSTVTTMTVRVANQTVLTGVFHATNYTVWLVVGMTPAGDPVSASTEFQRVAGPLLTAVKPG